MKDKCVSARSAYLWKQSALLLVCSDVDRPLGVLGLPGLVLLQEALYMSCTHAWPSFPRFPLSVPL